MYPQTEADHVIHALNIEGVLFERWCQNVVETSPHCDLHAQNYPVRFNDDASEVDFRAICRNQPPGRHLALVGEAKKNHPDLSRWVFFRRNDSADLLMRAHVCDPGEPNLAVASRVRLHAAPLLGGMPVSDEAREVRSDYLSRKAGDYTKTSYKSIHGAASQVCLATQAFLREETYVVRTALTHGRSLAPGRTLFVPVIVTTAVLSTIDFAPSDVNPQTGTIAFDAATLQDHDCVVYEYPIPQRLQLSEDYEALTHLTFRRRNSRPRLNIFVVHSTFFPTFLDRLATGHLLGPFEETDYPIDHY